MADETAPGHEASAVAARLAALERENAELRRRLEERPAAAAPAGPDGDATPPEAARRPRRGLRAA
ncbi:hypothetical protein, partial [Cellulosimicrobium funkei]